MTPELTIVADVFRHEAQAKHALEALRQAGFGYDQIGIAMHGHEGIDLQGDLENLGVPHDKASYYAQEVKAGHTVISVRPDGRDQEAHEIMRQSGALVDTSGAEAQQIDIDKQRAAWEQAIASHQAYLAEQRALKKQEDFHQPRSLKPRVELMPLTTEDVQVEQVQQPVMTPQQQSNVDPVIQPVSATEQQPIVTPSTDDDTQQLPVIRSHAQDDLVAEQPNKAETLQNNIKSEQTPFLAENTTEATSIDDEDTLRRARIQDDDDEDTLLRARTQEQDIRENFQTQTQPEESTNTPLVRTSLIVGGLVLCVGVGVALALLRGKQIRQFAFSMRRTMKM